MNDVERVRQLATQLMSEGYADNDADAQLLAVRLIAFADAAAADRRKSTESGGLPIVHPAAQGPA